MTMTDELHQFQRLGVRVTLHGKKLKVQAPKGVLTPALPVQLVKQKAALLALLSSRQSLTDEQETPPIDMLQQEAQMTFARVQGVTRVSTP